MIKTCLNSIFVLLLMSCDPVHSLKLENGRKDVELQVLYSSNYYTKNFSTGEENLNQKKDIDTIMVAPGETFEIGKVSGMYNPDVSDVRIDYLEVRFKDDTIILKGEDAIFSTIQKVENLNWRFIIK